MLRTCRASEDVVRAYQLLLGQRQESVSVASWFNEYCYLYGIRGGNDGGEEALEEAGRDAKATRRGRQAGGAAKRTGKKVRACRSCVGWVE